MPARPEPSLFPGLSKGDHLRLFFRGKAALLRSGPLTRTPLSFRQECLFAAREVGKAFPGSILSIFLSGGMDSEAIAEIFLEAGVPFRPVIVRYDGGLNAPDTELALDWCKRHARKPEIIDFDLSKFLRSSWPVAVARKYGCATPAYLVLMRVMSELPADRVPILGSGEPLLVRRRGADHVIGVQDEAAFCRLSRDLRRPWLTCFFLWSAELYFSYLTSPEYLEFVRQKGELYVSSIPLKERLYEREFRLARRVKRNGFERAARVLGPELARLGKSVPARPLALSSYAAELRYLTSSFVKERLSPRGSVVP